MTFQEDNLGNILGIIVNVLYCCGIVGKKPTVISTRSEMELVNVNSTRVDIDDTRVIIAIDDIKSLSPSLSEGI